MKMSKSRQDEDVPPMFVKKATTDAELLEIEKTASKEKVKEDLS